MVSIVGSGVGDGGSVATTSGVSVGCGCVVATFSVSVSHAITNAAMNAVAQSAIAADRIFG